jgi:hypothetical protein
MAFFFSSSSSFGAIFYVLFPFFSLCKGTGLLVTSALKCFYLMLCVTQEYRHHKHWPRLQTFTETPPDTKSELQSTNSAAQPMDLKIL